MKQVFLLFVLISLFYSVESSAKKRRFFKRSLSISLVNGYTFYSSIKKNDAYGLNDPGRLIDGDNQMYSFFSSLELARNFGRYEIGARIQNIFIAFISPFFKFNFIKNYSKALIVPSLTIGLIPSDLMGGWLRGSLALSLGNYSSLEPFVGIYGWYKIKEDMPKYEKTNLHFHVGVRTNLYF